MHPEILTKEQHNLLPFISEFRREYYLAGGTALALQIGHRESIDFDLFKEKVIRKNLIFKRIEAYQFSYRTTFTQSNQVNLLTLPLLPGLPHLCISVKIFHR